MHRSTRGDVFNIQKTPGPYNLPTVAFQGPRLSIASKPVVRINLSPGPGSYTPNQSQFMKKTPSYATIAKSKRQTEQHFVTNKNPGPGDYVKKASFDLTKGCFFSKSSRDQKVPLTPGPGSYKPKELKTGASARLERAGRKDVFSATSTRTLEVPIKNYQM